MKKAKAAGAVEIPCLLFERPGPQNTEAVLDWVASRAKTLGVRNILVASASGRTGLSAARVFKKTNLVIVTHSTGFEKPNEQQMSRPARRSLERAGAKVLTCQHAFGGVNRAVRRKLGTYELDEIIAFTLRTFGQGTKVAVEIALMAADAGLVPAGELCISLGGTGAGVDTALLLVPANAQDFFNLRVVGILAKPRV